MRRDLLTWKRLILVGVLIGLVGVVPAAGARNANPGVIPPQATARGNTYAEWSAAFWPWLLSIPFSETPFIETQGQNHLENQTGNVWFLPGVVSESFGPGSRDVTIPTGITLFVGIINVECSTIEADPFHGDTTAELTACAQSFEPAGVSAELDGRVLNVTTDYRVTSPLFEFEIPPNDNFLFLFEDETGGFSVADGYYLMLSPLSVGVHTLHFTGGYPDLGFALDSTYTIHVAPRGKK